MAKSIVVTSGKGGVGKTTTTANICTALAGFDKRVVAVDTDIGLRNLDIIMGLENRIVYNVVDVAKGRCKVKQALIRDKRNKNLFLLPTSQVDDKDAISPEDMKNIVKQLRDDFDFIVLDCPAGIEQGFKNAIADADLSIVVTVPEVSAVRDADRIIGLLQHNNIPVQLLVNRISPEMVEKGEMMSQDDVMEILAVDLLGVIEDDQEIIVSGNQGIPAVLNRTSIAGQAYLRIAKRLLGESVPIETPRSKRGFLSRFFGNIIRKERFA